MAIEFSCPHCQHMLRTADDKAGLSAKCPACSEIIWVPYSTGATVSPPDESADPPPEIGIPIAARTPPEASDATSEPDSEIPQPRTDGEITCPGCQATNDADARRCRFCGTSLEGVRPAVVSADSPPKTLEVGEVLSTAWRIYTDRAGLLIGATLLAIPLGLLALAVGGAPAIALTAAFAEADGDMAPVGLLIGLICSAPLWIVLGAPLAIGLTQLNLNAARGTYAQIGDLMHGFDREGRKLIPGMLLVLLVSAIANVFIIGSMLVWPLAFMYVHQRKPIGETFTSFFNRLSAEFAFVLLVGLVLYGIGFVVGILIYPCCIGILLLPFVMPFTNIVMAVGYLRLVGERTVFD